MALMQKKPLVGHSVPLYNLGQNRTLLIAGLGNPGKDYDQTRHNLGFSCLEAFRAANDFPAWIDKKDLKSRLSSLNMADKRVILAEPTTFMNLSGQAVQALLHFYKLAPSDLLVIHDELDIPFGQIRLRKGGSSAGHNGLNSIIEQIGEGFGRIRIGVHNDLADKADGADFVLGKLTKDEQAQLSALTKEVMVILTEYIHQGELPTETRSFMV